jgi:hypothetical protein
MILLRPLIAPCFGLLVMMAAPGMADEALSTGDMTWTVDSRGELRTGDWPLVSALSLGIEWKKSDAKKAGPDSPKPALPELRFGSDRSATMLGMDHERKNLAQTIQRSVRFDQERHAVRVLDIITSAMDEPQDLILRYQIRWQPTVVPKLTKPRFVSSQTTKAPIGALVATPDSKVPALFLLFGNDAKGWKRKFTDDQDLLSWAYTGVLPARGRVVMLHWLTFTSDVNLAAVSKLIKTLISGGLPMDDSLSDEVMKELANYPIPENATPTQSPAADGSRATLAWVKAFAEASHIERSDDVDHLVIATGTVVKGSFSASKVRLENNGGMHELPLTEIAAIRGGPSQSRVFLRDGTVSTGKLSWESATFQSETLGKLTLKPESLDQLVLRTSTADGAMPFKPAAWICDDAGGQVMAWKSFPSKPLQATWAGGHLTLNWEEILSIHQLPPPALEHELNLKDGSRLHGWIDLTESGLPTPDCAALAGTPGALLALLEGKAAETKISGQTLTLADGSVLAGNPAASVLRWITKDGEIQTKSTDLVQIKRSATTDALLYELETSTGTRLSGQPAEPALDWKHGSRTISVPWRLITELKPTTKP